MELSSIEYIEEIQDIPLGKRLYQYRSGVQALPDTYCLLDQFLFSVSAILAEV